MSWTKFRLTDMPRVRVAYLGTDVTGGASGQCLVGGGIAQRQEECMHAMIDAVADESCHEHAVCGVLSQASGPPLCGGERGAVAHELVAHGVERGGSLHAAHERSMTQLRLRVGTQDLVVECRLEPLLLLLVAGLGHQCGNEHGAVQLRGQQVAEVECHLSDICGVGDVVVAHDVDHGCPLLAAATQTLRAREIHHVPAAHGGLILDQCVQVALVSERLRHTTPNNSRQSEGNAHQ